MKACEMCTTAIEGDLVYANMVDNVMYPYCSSPCGEEHMKRLEGLKLLAQTDLGD